MKPYIIALLCAVQLTLGSPALRADSYTHTLRFSPEDLRITETEADGRTYTEITMKGMESVGEAGAPAMPYTSFHISIPPEATDFTVTVTPKTTPLLYPLTSDPLPAQPDYPTSIGSSEERFTPLESKYLQAGTTFPAESAEVSGVSAIGGYNRVATVSVCPLLCTAAQDKLALMPEMEVTLSWKTDATAAANLLYPRFADMIEEADEQARQMVVNPEAVGNYATTRSELAKSQQAATTQERIPYVIVTTKDLAPSLERLAALRRLRGFESRIVCIEDILADLRFKDGDLISGINDEAGKLRAYIYMAYVDYGSEYVLLAGNYNLIPGRIIKNKNGKCLSDTYYRNLTSIWTYLTGSRAYDDLTNSIADVVQIGRLPVTTSIEIEQYIEKLIQYEYNVLRNDLSYMNNAYVLLGTDSQMTDRYKNESRPIHESVFTNLVLDHTFPYSVLKGNEAIVHMNSEKWGYVEWRCHGLHDGVFISRSDGYYGLNALDSENSKFLEEEKNGLDNWKNKGYPCWSLSSSCELGKYEAPEKINFIQSFILGKDYGGVAFFGNEGIGWKTGSAALEDSLFLVARNCFLHGSQMPYSGFVLKQGISNLQDDKDHEESYKYAKRVMGLYGDPLLPVWVNSPYSFYGKNNSANFGNDEKIFVGEYSLSGHTSPIQYLSNAKEQYNRNTPTNKIVCNHRPDMVPFIYPCLISGLYVDHNDYWFAGKIKFSNNTNSYSIRLPESISLDIEALEEIEIEGSFALSNSSQLNIRSHHGIAIEKFCFPSSGEINLSSAEEIIISSETTIPLGVEVTFESFDKKK